MNIDNILTSLTNKKHYCIAYSGGIDSHVLLHLSAQIKTCNIRAVHINHGFSVNANEWERHCQQVCENLAIPFSAYRLAIKINPGDSLEAVAREQRYAQFKKILQDNECLLTAHNADDQVETVFLQLMRGAGVKGLAAMPLADDSNTHLRPLLPISRQAIEAYAQSNNLQWIEDESNQDQRFDRNYFRHQVLPVIKKRWPQALQTVARSAKHCGEAADLLTELAMLDLKKCVKDKFLVMDYLLTLPAARQRNTLRVWIDNKGFGLPTTAQLEQIRKDVLLSDLAASPCLRWEQQEIRRYKNRLYVMPVSTGDEGDKILQFYWQNIKKKIAEGQCGYLNINDMVLRFRQGGERIRPAGRKETQTLKNLLQQWQVPPWERGRIPLLYYRGELVAVLGYCSKEGFQVLEYLQPEFVAS